MDEQVEATLQALLRDVENNRLDPEERRELQHAIDELQESLDRFDISSASLAKRLHESTRQFAEQHPQLALQAGRCADMLAQMGI
ncbi:MAG: DUF4404 family protein [Planctomycetota bacterium]